MRLVVIKILRVILPLNVGGGLLSTDNFQNLIDSSLYHHRHFQKISSKSIYNFLRRVVDRQTNGQTDKQTNTCKKSISLAEIKKTVYVKIQNMLSLAIPVGNAIWDCRCSFFSSFFLFFPPQFCPAHISGTVTRRDSKLSVLLGPAV